VKRPYLRHAGYAGALAIAAACGNGAGDSGTSGAGTGSSGGAGPGGAMSSGTASGGAGATGSTSAGAGATGSGAAGSTGAAGPSGGSGDEAPIDASSGSSGAGNSGAGTSGSAGSSPRDAGEDATAARHDASTSGTDASTHGGGDASPPPAGDGGSCTVAPGAEIGVFQDPDTAMPIAPPNPPGITFTDTDGKAVDAHGGGIIKVCDTFYLHGEYFLSTTTDNNFNGFSMYSSKDLATWKNEGIVLPQQASGQLGPNRKGERPHIIQCPATGEFVLYAHSADVTYQADKEVVYATANTVTGPYDFQGSLTNSSGTIAAHSDMSALTDGSKAYVITESGWVYTLSSDCHSWVSSAQYGVVNGTTGGGEAPTIFKAGSTYYWIMSDKTGWRANDNFYSTAPAMTGPWTYQGYVAPMGDLTWMSQVTWVMPVAGTKGTTYLFWGDHWYGDQDTTAPGQHNYLTTFVFQPLVFQGTAISMPTYNVTWQLDVGAGTWSD
jgi:hypothetical protein